MLLATCSPSALQTTRARNRMQQVRAPLRPRPCCVPFTTCSRMRWWTTGPKQRCPCCCRQSTCSSFPRSLRTWSSTKPHSALAPLAFQRASSRTSSSPSQLIAAASSCQCIRHPQVSVTTATALLLLLLPLLHGHHACPRVQPLPARVASSLWRRATWQP